MREHFLELARYDAWANAQLLTAVDGLACSDERVRQLLAHLTAAKLIWLSRLAGDESPPPQIPLWPPWNCQESARRLRLLDRELLGVIGREDLERISTYRTSTGIEMKSSLSDIIVHLVNHGTYHRGQLASAVKRAGGMPAVTDFIAWSRDGKPSVSITPPPISHPPHGGGAVPLDA